MEIKIRSDGAKSYYLTDFQLALIRMACKELIATEGVGKGLAYDIESLLIDLGISNKERDQMGRIMEGNANG